MDAVEQVAPELGVAQACRVIGVARASFYRHRRPPRGRPCILERPPTPKRRRPNALTDVERQRILHVLHSERFVDASPIAAYFTLLDEGAYLGSWRTFYRVLQAHGEVRERRNQLHHPHHPVPRLHTSRPNEVWTWDVERHEALWNRAVMKGHRLRPVAADR